MINNNNVKSVSMPIDDLFVYSDWHLNNSAYNKYEKKKTEVENKTKEKTEAEKAQDKKSAQKKKVKCLIWESQGCTMRCTKWSLPEVKTILLKTNMTDKKTI